MKTVAIIALGVAGLWLSAAWCSARDVQALPPVERAAFVQRTLANLEGPCAQGAGPALASACRAQAELLFDFPECDGGCRQLARRFTHRATR